MKFEFLGTSDTGGIPLHQCTCKVCQEAREQGISNRSTSAYLTLDDGSVILFDAGYDALMDRFNTVTIRAVFLTHFHADHCLGLMRLRKSVTAIPCYIPDDADGFGDLLVRKDSLEYRVLNPLQSVEIQGVTITAVALVHSKPTLGYVIRTEKKSVAYLTDCGDIEETMLTFLHAQRIDHLFIDACYSEGMLSHKHCTPQTAAALIRRIEPQMGYFIHASCHTLLPIREKKIKVEYPYIEQGFHIEV